MNKIPITEFKAKCLSVFREVEEHHESVSIEKRGKTIAHIIPVSETGTGGYGCMKGKVTIHDDINKPLDEEWNANT